ncbi:glyoxalase [Nostocoides sp. F2B08]|uniref:VOC family protein n=1 Tax=Nostocoides sp. F2B08 TaxID=2653936 RepID=UPI00126359FC|nr:VOC family protein [Tetrasphaera sp. F2B08]KAB7743503.1 glyoxalase [Tetrasphaera sp. F2B08]
MAAVGLHHVLIACPAGSEDLMREFYSGVVGLREIPKPPQLAARGGVWFAVGQQELHCGVQGEDGGGFVPARKAHPCLVVDDLDALAAAVADRGGEVVWADEIPGVRRFHTSDPVGNRVEFQAQR